MKRGFGFLLVLFIMVILAGPPAFSAPQVVERIVAMVNDEVILLSELEDAFGPLRTQYQVSYQGEELVNRLAKGKEEVLNQLVETRILLQEARARSIEVSPEEVAAMFENVKKIFSSEDKFKQALEEQGLSPALLSRRLEDQARIKRLVEQEVKLKISLDVEEARRYYETNQDKFFHGRQYRLQHILIKNIPGKESEAEAKAQEVLAKIKEGTDFSLLAKEYSEDPNTLAGGDLGFLEKDKLIPEMKEVVENLKVGEVSGVIKTRLGYEIIKVGAIKEASAKGFDEVKGEITQKLLQDKFASAYNQWLEGLKKNSYIHINKEAL